jgi:DNA (cytosine-5)-methyltransferase 1
MNIFKLGSLFSGSGTSELAATLCGIEPVFASEIEKFPIAVTSKHFPNMKHLGDITKIDGSKIEPVDIITAGSPCTDLSIAGKRAGLIDGKQSSLFMEAIRIIREMREATNNEYPRFVVWENVCGTFSSNKGQDFRTVLESFAETSIPIPASGKWANAGMVELPNRQIAWRVLDSAAWGVPQRRKRIFLVADFNGHSAGEILFKPESLSWDTAQGRKTWQKNPSNIKRSIGATDTEYLTGWDVQDKRIFTDKGASPTLSGSDGGGGRNPAGLIFTQTYPDITGTLCASDAGLNRPAGQGNETDLCIVQKRNVAYGFCPNNSITAGGVSCEKEKSPTLSTTKRSGVAFACNQRDEVRDLKDCAGALQAQPGMKQQTFVSYGIGNGQANQSLDMVAGVGCRNGTHPAHINKIVRRLTPRECAKLQGFPSSWCDGIPHSDSAEYKMWGNGQTLNCVLYIMENIAEVLRAS